MGTGALHPASGLRGAAEQQFEASTLRVAALTLFRLTQEAEELSKRRSGPGHRGGGGRKGGYTQIHLPPHPAPATIPPWRVLANNQYA